MPDTGERYLTLTEALQWRYATKLFDPRRKIPEAEFNIVRQSLFLAPSSYGLQPWKFIIVRDPMLRQALRQASRNQAQVTDASHFIVLASLKVLDTAYIDRHLARVAEVRKLDPSALGSYRDGAVVTLVEGPRAATITEWAQRQTYLPLGFAMLTAAQMGIDSCPMEGFDHTAYDKLLRLEGGPYSSLAALALGYRSPDDKYGRLAKVRFKEEEVFETR